MRTNEERLAVLEEKHSVTRADIADIQDTLEETNERLTAIDTKLAKQQSFWAGVTFLAAAVGFVLKAIWEYLQKSIQ